MQMNNYKNTLKEFKTLFFAFLATFILVCATAAPANAQSSSCDPEYMDALKARAWMEAQREIAQNKNIISKPDSVLELSCFHHYLETLANRATFLFSETIRWGEILQPPFLSMDVALTHLVGRPLYNYLDSNFGHGYQNDRGLDRIKVNPNLPYPRVPLGIGREGPLTSEGHTFTNEGVILGNFLADITPCNHMLISWNLAKSMDFIDDEQFDGFHSLGWYAGLEGVLNDPRQMLVSGGVWEKPPGIPVRFATNMNIAFNGDPVPYNVPDGDPNANYNEDSVVTFLNLLAPAPACGSPIPTGLRIDRSDFSVGSFSGAYQEHVCPNPGCYYVPTGTNSGQCLP
jgi:hypothetical protein